MWWGEDWQTRRGMVRTGKADKAWTGEDRTGRQGMVMYGVI